MNEHPEGRRSPHDRSNGLEADEELAATWRGSRAYAAAARIARRIDRESVIELLGALAMHPANATAQLVLEALVHVAADLEPLKVQRRATTADVRRLASAGFGLIPSSLDPPEQPFARPLLHGPQFGVVTLGLLVDVDYELERTLEALDALPEPAEELQRAAQAVLALMFESSRRAGLSGVVAPEGDGRRVAIPGDNVVRRLRGAASFSDRDLRALVGNDWRTVLDPLVGPSAPGETVWDGSNGTLSAAPLVATRDGLVVAVPGMVLDALRRHLTQALRAQSDGFEQLREAALWRDITHSLSLMRVWPMPAEDGGQADATPSFRVFRVDEDQCIGVLLVGTKDEGEDGGLEAIDEARTQLGALGSGHVLLVVFAPDPSRDHFLGLTDNPADVAEILMRPSELAIIARTEPGEPRALADWAAASTRLRDHAHVITFSALDEFAIYRQNHSSYYLSDDAQPTMVSVTPGSGLDLRLEAARSLRIELIVGPTGASRVRVAPRWDGHEGVWFPLDQGGLGAFAVRTDPPVWVLTPPLPQAEPDRAQGWLSVAEAAAYWVWEARALVEPTLRAAGLPVATVTVEGLERWGDAPEDGDAPYVRLRAIPATRTLRMLLEPSLAVLAQSPGNAADRQLLSAMLEGLSTLCDREQEEAISREVELAAPPGHKKMMIVLNVGANPDLGPEDVPRARIVQEARTGEILDELGQGLTGRGWGPQTPEAVGSSHRILMDAVEVLLGMLEREAATFEPAVLEALLLRNEAILRERADLGFHLPPRLACFPQDAAQAMAKIDRLDPASVAGRFLVEFVAARPPDGRRAPSLGALDHLLALADALVGRGQACDMEYHQLVRTNARLLRSGRLGLDDRAMGSAAHAYRRSQADVQSEQALGAYSRRWSDAPEGGEALAALDVACRAEWGYGFRDLGGVLGALADRSLEESAPVLTLRRAEVIAYLAAEAAAPVEVLEDIVRDLTLEPRAGFVTPPAPHLGRDVYPWRYNRDLSLLRRPLVLRSANGRDELVFGRRALLESLRHTLALIESSRLRARSKEMRVYMGRLSRERGTRFNVEVAELMGSLVEGPVLRQVAKVGGKLLVGEDGPLGDVDVLGVDPRARVIWAIECKALAPSRTVHEVAGELEDLVGRDRRRGHLEKHGRRLEALRRELDTLLADLGLPGAGWVVEGAFVVDDDLLGPYLRDTPVPVLTAARLAALVSSRREGATDAG